MNELSVASRYKNSLFQKIERLYLLELSIEKLKDNNFISNTINQFKLLKNKNYENIENHQIEKFKIDPLFSIKVKTTSYWQIETTTNDKEVFEKFLKFLEKKLNLEIQNFIIENFNQSILNGSLYKKYTIEDIDIKIKNLSTDHNIEVKNYVELLKEIKGMLLEDKNEKRLIDAFSETPIKDQSKFIAAKINENGTSYKRINKKNRSKTALLLITILIGLFIELVMH